MKSQITIKYLSGKTEVYQFVLDEEQTSQELMKRCEALFSGNTLSLRVQHEDFAENDTLLMIPFSSIESISLGLPFKEYHFPQVLYVNPVQASCEAG